ncbi:MAG: 16S rRNA (guanine(966)-N(2))-methyltransferase RsmD [Planctomycetota bacterium]|nr:MAG: 16S rRNA (guanine(966)-N(2))-methyltransferase RsmD [Planctomycetota bacterium]
MYLRVAGGEFRGRKLRTVPGVGTRPLLGKVREAVFNILGPEIQGAQVWDLFAGTGASGIEALSRGAARVIFVEKANSALRVLRANLDELGLDLVAPGEKQRAIVLRGNAWEPQIIDPVTGEPFEGEPEPEMPPSFVFFDPPYAAVREDPTSTVDRLGKLLDRLAPAGRLVFHFPEGVLDEDDLAHLGVVDMRVWGSSAVAFIEGVGAEQSDDARLPEAE